MCWVSFQSNVFVDNAFVEGDFIPKLEEMKHELTGMGWVLPELAVNMRNQKNISSVTVKSDDIIFEVQASIRHLQSGSTVVGEVPTFVRVKGGDWAKKKAEVLKHVLELMKKKNDKNIVILHQFDIKSKDLKNELTKISNIQIVTYPSSKNKQQNRSVIKNFVENDSHILVTRDKYFNGAEASNVICINSHDSLYAEGGNKINSLMRAVEQLTFINVESEYSFNFDGVKEDKTFLSHHG